MISEKKTIIIYSLLKCLVVYIELSLGVSFKVLITTSARQRISNTHNQLIKKTLVGEVKSF